MIGITAVVETILVWTVYDGTLLHFILIFWASALRVHEM